MNDNELTGKRENEMLEKFRRLTPANQAIAQSNVSVALAVQENMKKSLQPKTVRQPGGDLR